jgi:pyruvate, water dikinase
LNKIGRKGECTVKKIAHGMSVSPGTVRGTARVIHTVADLEKVEEGNILVVSTSHPLYALGVMKSAALICENGGKLSHLCVVALEMGIPCVTQVHGVMNEITDGQEIYLDGSEGDVYVEG